MFTMQHNVVISRSIKLSFIIMNLYQVQLCLSVETLKIFLLLHLSKSSSELTSNVFCVHLI